MVKNPLKFMLYVVAVLNFFYGFIGSVPILSIVLGASAVIAAETATKDEEVER